MKFSFIVIAFNEEKTIQSCIECILRQNNLHNFEIIIVDDGSTDSTSEIVKELIAKNAQIRLHKNISNQGRGYSRREGIIISKGEYIIFVDADIQLQPNWLEICLKYIINYDAIGGIAVPDGDIVYIARKFNIPTKIVNHTALLTGSNCIIKRTVFEEININRNFKEGEDVDFFWSLSKSKFKLKLINNLTVKHNEIKSYVNTIKWLFQSGIGANRLYKKFHRIRIPDITLIFFVLVVFCSIISSIILKTPAILLFIYFYIIVISTLHISQKFILSIKNLFKILFSIIIDSTLISSYFAGRIYGFIHEK